MILTSANAHEAVDLMFDSIEDHYAALKLESEEFFNKNVITLPSEGSIEIAILNAMEFHCFYRKGKRYIVPNELLEYVKKTSLQKVLRKRYACNCVLLKEKLDLSFHKVPVRVIELIPSIFHEFKNQIFFDQKNNPSVHFHEITRHKVGPKVAKYSVKPLSSKVYPNDMLKAAPYFSLEVFYKSEHWKPIVSDIICEKNEEE